MIMRMVLHLPNAVDLCLTEPVLAQCATEPLAAVLCLRDSAFLSPPRLD